MPDTYITIPNPEGSVNISEDVIAVIAVNAVREVDGVTAFSNAAGVDLIGKKPVTKGLRVSFEDNTVRVDLAVMVRYGLSITAVGEKVQDAVASAVESMTGLKSCVNVHVSGVAFEK